MLRATMRDAPRAIFDICVGAAARRILFTNMEITEGPTPIVHLFVRPAWRGCSRATQALQSSNMRRQNTARKGNRGLSPACCFTTYYAGPHNGFSDRSR